MAVLIIIVFIFVWAGICYLKQTSDESKIVNKNDEMNDVPIESVEIYFKENGTSYRFNKAIEIARKLEADDALFLEMVHA